MEERVNILSLLLIFYKPLLYKLMTLTDFDNLVQITHIVKE